jgi:hypothetical protein
MVPAVAAQGGHCFRVLAVGGAVLLPCWGHTRTSHMRAFGRCIRHGLLLKAIYLRCAEENSPNLSGQPSALPKWQNSTLASQALARRFCTAPRLPCSSFWSGAPESPYLGSGTQSRIGGGQQKPITPNIAVIPSHSASAPFSFHAHLQTPNALIRSHIHRLVSSNCRAFSRLASVSFAPDSIRATSLSRSPSSILRMVVRVLPLFSVFSITKC